ncbi:MAG: UDP-N-acetylmuramoyl-L-alanine--D-glutamate ligase [Lunatimonas sp.]|uniref:UDP-N-acetylmuramoyl-L-alanine--D-glutamate ligase n=1 Tax=Lunatimonas sp. TaxID=2060141 RepID=UPI00263BE034|nr:UDP-N-acetylmuramoyl-L-alanine--D-glutamate ligase [Lunatimonas sp.]MCC5936218.1 UDP-N-acetylmuramoyl-L-alanine--D-glutamate ligase [Lunatimonas sp.]
MMERIVILGAGESGVGAALLAAHRGHQVMVSDAGSISEPRKELLSKAGIPFEEGTHSAGLFDRVDLVIKSPGIPYSLPMIQDLLTRDVPVVDELEFASSFSHGNIVAITGTNGKTTTTLLTFHLLKEAGLDVGLAGNVGKSWAGQLVQRDHAWWVLETSSFQIEGFRKLKPKVAILLNITPDHLDRYGYQLDAYAEAKFKLMDAMDREDHFIYFNEQDIIRNRVEAWENSKHRYPIAWDATYSASHFVQEDLLHIVHGNETLRFDLSETNLRGKHNQINALAAIQAALIAGLTETQIRHGLQTFVNAPHRMEGVGTVDGIRFINDSKGTNVDATAYALAAYKEPLIWIAGGVDKGNDYSVLIPLVKDRVKHLICLGKDNEKLKNAFGGVIPRISETKSIEEAIGLAVDFGQSGDLALLSPACASFDLFKNYEDRGDQFRKAVKRMGERRQL